MNPDANAGGADPAEFLDAVTEPVPRVRETMDTRRRAAAAEATVPRQSLVSGIHRVALPDDEFAEVVCVNCGTQSRGPRCPACEHPHRVQDRFEADLGVVGLVTDRGILHARNEDAVAAAVVPDDKGQPEIIVLVVCDGVSSSPDPQAASGTAARTGADACLAALAGDRTAEEASAAGMAAASEAVRNLVGPDGDAPSCTYVSAIVRTEPGGRISVTVSNIGDSRAYWLAAGEPAAEQPARPGHPAPLVGSQKLTVDDSWAQTLVEAGAMDERAAMADPRAHTLMRWLGADAGQQPWSADSIRTYFADGSGVLLLCTDGLWNYLPGPAELAERALGVSIAEGARVLVDYAVVCGGSDNITVALMPIPFAG
ncbi:PP2C family protein-serine/threonine phosphatase [Nocardia sp. NBC_01329]|uniref:PP2C family protein-serine/threonine phosphatase n=1 Tax=Nocardia sp. NBC_01329 TaxID=2903594 RepID=UPI002E1015A1|nr:phosphatase [Nocardia sp. NBC_01329]